MADPRRHSIYSGVEHSSAAADHKSFTSADKYAEAMAGCYTLPTSEYRHNREAYAAAAAAATAAAAAAAGGKVLPHPGAPPVDNGEHSAPSTMTMMSMTSPAPSPYATYGQVGPVTHDLAHSQLQHHQVQAGSVPFLPDDPPPFPPPAPPSLDGFPPPPRPPPPPRLLPPTGEDKEEHAPCKKWPTAPLHPTLNRPLCFRDWREFQNTNESNNRKKKRWVGMSEEARLEELVRLELWMKGGIAHQHQHCQHQHQHQHQQGPEQHQQEQGHKHWGGQPSREQQAYTSVPQHGTLGTCDPNMYPHSHGGWELQPQPQPHRHQHQRQHQHQHQHLYSHQNHQNHQHQSLAYADEQPPRHPAKQQASILHAATQNNHPPPPPNRHHEDENEKEQQQQHISKQFDVVHGLKLDAKRNEQLPQPNDGKKKKNKTDGGAGIASAILALRSLSDRWAGKVDSSGGGGAFVQDNDDGSSDDDGADSDDALPGSKPETYRRVTDVKYRAALNKARKKVKKRKIIAERRRMALLELASEAGVVMPPSFSPPRPQHRGNDSAQGGIAAAAAVAVDDPAAVATIDLTDDIVDLTASPGNFVTSLSSRVVSNPPPPLPMPPHLCPPHVLDPSNEEMDISEDERSAAQEEGEINDLCVDTDADTDADTDTAKTSARFASAGNPSLAGNAFVWSGPAASASTLKETLTMTSTATAAREEEEPLAMRTVAAAAAPPPAELSASAYPQRDPSASLTLVPATGKAVVVVAAPPPPPAASPTLIAEALAEKREKLALALRKAKLEKARVELRAAQKRKEELLKAKLMRDRAAGAAASVPLPLPQPPAAAAVCEPSALLASAVGVFSSTTTTTTTTTLSVPIAKEEEEEKQKQKQKEALPNVTALRASNLIVSNISASGSEENVRVLRSVTGPYKSGEEVDSLAAEQGKESDPERPKGNKTVHDITVDGVTGAESAIGINAPSSPNKKRRMAEALKTKMELLKRKMKLMEEKERLKKQKLDTEMAMDPDFGEVRTEPKSSLERALPALNSSKVKPLRASGIEKCIHSEKEAKFEGKKTDGDIEQEVINSTLDTGIAFNPPLSENVVDGDGAETQQPRYQSLEDLRRRQLELKRSIEESTASQRQIRHHLVVSNLREMVNKQRRLLLQQGSKLAESSALLKECVADLSAEEAALQESERGLEDLLRRKRILEGMVSKATQKLMNERRRRDRLTRVLHGEKAGVLSWKEDGGSRKGTGGNDTDEVTVTMASETGGYAKRASRKRKGTARAADFF